MPIQSQTAETLHRNRKEARVPLAGWTRMKSIVEEFCSIFVFVIQEEGLDVAYGSSLMWDKCVEEIQKYVRV